MVGRLTKRPQFLAAASGRRFRTERMTVQGRKRGPGEASEGTGLRYGLTVTKKVGNAPERNRIKRRLRAAMRMAAAEHAAIDMDVVVIGRRDILTADFASLVEDLRRALAVVSRPTPPGPGKPALPSPSPTVGEPRGRPHA